MLLALNSVRTYSSEMFGSWLLSFPANQHCLVLSGGATLVWTIWKTCNASCFKNRFLADPSVLIFQICNHLVARARLQGTKPRKARDGGDDAKKGARWSFS